MERFDNNWLNLEMEISGILNLIMIKENNKHSVLPKGNGMENNEVYVSLGFL